MKFTQRGNVKSFLDLNNKIVIFKSYNSEVVILRVVVEDEQDVFERHLMWSEGLYGKRVKRGR